VVFHETGLPIAEPWCLTFAGVPACSSLNKIRLLNLSPGTYPYAVQPMVGQVITAKASGVAVPLSGNLTLSTHGISVALRYVYPYSVTFIESGLPNGTNWSVKIKGITINSTTDHLVFALGNGTYGFRITPIPGYRFLLSFPKAKVIGGPVVITVTFSAHPLRASPPSTTSPVLLGSARFARS
jgi:hypothetical protein